MNIDSDLLLMISSSTVGDGEPDLGEKLMSSFLAMLLESDKLPVRIICMNSGIFLTTNNSPVYDLLKKYEDAGCEILSCKTCLDYYGRADKLIIGQPTNMKETVTAVLKSSRILTP